MAKCCVEKNGGDGLGPLEWFEHMIENCYEYATAAKDKGKKVVGIMCEYTPRELIMAAGSVPVCLCGGSAEMIEPAQEDLPANLCPLIKSTYGYCVQKANPFLEMADMLVADLVGELELARPFAAEPKSVETAVHEDAQGPQVLFALQMRAQAVQAEVQLPCPMALTDALTGERYEGRDAIRIPLPGYSCRMFLCERPADAQQRPRPPSARRSNPPC